MNIQDYISSGIVESYVLGLADAAERAEFERMCATNDAVRAARDEFERKLEQQAFSNAIAPPADLRNKIFAELNLDPGVTSSTVTQQIPAATAITSDSTPETGKVVNWMRYLVAASVILLVGSTALNFYLFKQYREYSTLYSDLLATHTDLVKNFNASETQRRSYETDFAIMKNPNTTVVLMPGTNVKTSPDTNSLATVFWQQSSNEVYLLVNKMPEPGADKQYQLWALVDGKPIDAGVFDVKTSTVLVRMKNISKAQTFAITLEKRGGSVAPTMSQLYVLGNVKT